MKLHKLTEGNLKERQVLRCLASRETVPVMRVAK
jgi:hypothetical protein